MENHPPTSTTEDDDDGEDKGAGYVTIKKLAILINKSYITTLKYVKSGKVKSIRVGSEYRIMRQEVIRFLREGNHPDSSPYNRFRSRSQR